MLARHPAWPEPEAQWVPLAPGVRWKLRRPDGAVQTQVSAQVGAVMSRVYAGRAGLETLGLDPEAAGEVLDLDVLSGYASVLTGCLYAAALLEDWSGVDDPATGQPLDCRDPAAVRAALVLGPPPAGDPLLTPFLAWLEGPRRSMASETVRLRVLARDHWTGGAERCAACADAGDTCAKGGAVDGQLCPALANRPQTAEGVSAWAVAVGQSALWVRAGMAGQVTGLNYRDALLAMEADGITDHGAAFVALQAIEAGRIEAEIERLEAERERS